MLRAVMFTGLSGLVLISVGLLVWQTDFAKTDAPSRYHARPEAPEHAGVPQSMTESAPLLARAIDTVQDWIRPEPTRQDKPRVNRGGFRNPDGFDVRYTQKPAN